MLHINLISFLVWLVRNSEMLSIKYWKHIKKVIFVTSSLFFNWSPRLGFVFEAWHFVSRKEYEESPFGADSLKTQNLNMFVRVEYLKLWWPWSPEIDCRLVFWACAYWSSINDVTQVWTIFDSSPTVMLFSYKTYKLPSQNPCSLPLVAVTSFMYDPIATKAEVPCQSTAATVQLSHFNEVLVLHEIDGKCAARPRWKPLK